MLIEITIPVLNEEETLRVQMLSMREKISRLLTENINVQFLIADNGSTDKTQSIGLELAEQFNDIRYIRLNRKGVGLALKSSWTQSSADIVGYMDLDLATDLKHMKSVFSAFDESSADIVSGSRRLPTSMVEGRSRFRTFTSNVFNILLKMLFRNQFSDGMCGFKFLRRMHVSKLIEVGAVSDGWFFATEILLVGEHLNLEIQEIPVNWTDDPNSKVKPVRLAIEYIQAMLVLKRKLQSQG